MRLWYFVLLEMLLSSEINAFSMLAPSSTTSSTAGSTTSRTEFSSADTKSSYRTKRAPKRRRRRGKKAAFVDEAPRGRIANVNWQRVPMGAVRQHPRYTALPPARAVTRSSARKPSVAAAAAFRQDTWRWDALHAGRLTGRRVASALGFFDGRAAAALAVPRTMRGRAIEAAAFLNEEETRGDVARLFEATGFDDEEETEYHWERSEGAWGLGVVANAPLPATDPVAARLLWGKAQEGNGVAAAVEYVAKLYGDDARVCEAGMCAAEAPSLAALKEAWAVEDPSFFDALDNSPRRVATSVRLGASPDGLVVRRDGAVEVLEIKSVCPFVARRSGNGLVLRDRGPATAIRAWLVPQLMLGIYCAGSRCDGAILASVSATKGANFFQVPRDDVYIHKMLQVLDDFAAAAREGSLLDFDAVPGYDAFVDHTRRIAARARPTSLPVLRRPEDTSPVFLDPINLQPHPTPRAQHATKAPHSSSKRRKQRTRHRRGDQHTPPSSPPRGGPTSSSSSSSSSSGAAAASLVVEW